MSNLNSFLQGHQINSFNSRILSRRLLYDAFGKIIDQGPNTLASQQSVGQHIYESLLTKVNAQNSGNLHAPESSNILKDSATQTIIDSIDTQATLQTIQQFYDMYMGTSGDIQYRLGEVKGVLPMWHSLTEEEQSKKSSANSKLESMNMTLTVTPQTDKYGRIYTRSNFVQDFYPKAYSPSSSKEPISYREPYANMFFPPYFTNEQYIGTLGEWAKYAKQIKDGTYKSTASRVDLDSMYNYRGGFTYRTPSFKSVNDNITFLQWLMEKVTGICSTYMTEWDLSQYFQEGLNSNNSASHSIQYISLVHRLGDDSIVDGQSDSRSYAYGVVNAAASKVYLSSLCRWYPGEFPLSAFWMGYPEWSNHTTERFVLATSEDAVYVPMFYKRALDYDKNNDSKTSILGRLQYDDFVGAATSGWTDWKLSYWKAFYGSSGDGLSSADIEHLNAATGYTKVSALIDSIMADVYGMCYSTSGAVIEDSQEWENSGGSSPKQNSAKTSGGSLGGSSEMSYEDAVLKLLPSKSSKTGSAIKAVNTVSGSTSPSAAAYVDEDGNSYSVNGADSTSVKNKFLGLISEDADSSSGQGIPQRNPVLFGGPHSPWHSPYSIQSYFEENNPFLRNVPRMGLGYDPDADGKTSPWNLDTHKDYWRTFTNVEKWSSGNSNYSNFAEVGANEYERTFTMGRDLLNEGLPTYKIAYASLYTNVTATIQGTGSIYYSSYYSKGRRYYTSSRVSISFPTKINGATVTYRHRYGWSSKWDWRKWRYVRKKVDLGYDYWYGYKTVRLNWANPYYRWRNTWRYSRRSVNYYQYRNQYVSTWIGYDGYWYATVRIPYCVGTYTIRRTVPYKRYLLHSMPNTPWQLCQVQNYTYQVTANGSREGIFKRIWQWWFGAKKTTYTCSVASSQEKWRLVFPKSSVRRWKSTMSNKNGHRTWKTFTHTYQEDECSQYMIDIAGNSSSQIIFLGGSMDNTEDRNTNGPQYIFRAPVKHETYTYIYWKAYRKSKRHRCHRDYWWEYKPLMGYDDQISVDVRNVDVFLTHTNGNVWNNIDKNGKELNSWQVKANDVGAETYEGLATHLDTNRRRITYPRLDETFLSKYSFEGIGLLGSIPGLTANVEDRPELGQYYRRYLRFSTDIGENYAMSNIPYKYCTISQNYSYFSIYHNVRTLVEDGASSYTEHLWDQGLKNAWLKACLSATFYRDASMSSSQTAGENPTAKPYYVVAADAPFRYFYNVLLYQRTYYDTLKQLFCGKMEKVDGQPYIFSFDALGKLIRGNDNTAGIVSNKVLYLSDPNNIYMTDPDTPKSGKIEKGKVFQYNQWIKEALQIFTTNSETNATNRARLQSEIDTRILLMDNAISSLKSVVWKEIGEWTYKQYSDAVGWVKTCYTGLIANDYIDKFLLSYLNVLYEYRRYFVNKRMNKQDGTMWCARHLEALIPMVAWKGSSEAPAVDPTKVVSDPSYDVAFMEVEKGIVDKVSSAMKSEKAEDDVVTTCYVEVKYATEAQYNEACEQYKNGEITELPYIKVRPWSYKVNNGSYVYDSNGERVKTWSSTVKYVVKPKDRQYILTSKEYLKNKANIDYNSNETDDTKWKYVDEKIDTAHWYIKWGLPDTSLKDEIGETPIVFDVFASVNIDKVKDLLLNEVSSPNEIVCGSKESADYWQVSVKTKYPRLSGFKNDVRLEPYEETATVNEELAEVVLNGAMTSSLYPIVEDQPCVMPSDAELASNLMSAIGGSIS